MENACKCRACGRKFKPDVRSQGRQGYCSRPAWQRWRRAATQRLRRQNAAAGKVRTQLPGGARRLQAASVVSEADIRAENPAIIGLISMVTGLTNLEDIERVYRQLWLRGKQILSGSQFQGQPKHQIINLLEQSDGWESVTG